MSLNTCSHFCHDYWMITHWLIMPYFLELSKRRNTQDLRENGSMKTASDRWQQSLVPRFRFFLQPKVNIIYLRIFPTKPNVGTNKAFEYYNSPNIWNGGLFLPLVQLKSCKMLLNKIHPCHLQEQLKHAQSNILEHNDSLTIYCNAKCISKWVILASDLVNHLTDCRILI